MSEHQKTTQAVVTSQAAINPHQTVEQFALFNVDGTPSNLGAQGEAVDDVAAFDSDQITGGQSPTEGEYNDLQADVVSVQTTVDELLASLRAAGIIAS